MSANTWDGAIRAVDIRGKNVSNDHIKGFDSEAFKQEHEILPYNRLAKAMVDAKEGLEIRKKAVVVAQKKFDILRLQIIPDRMCEDDMQSIKIAGIGRLSLTNDAHVSVASGMKYDLHKWLKDNGFEEVIQPSVNSSTLKAFIKEQKREGNPVPDERTINYAPFLRASLTKT